MCQLLNHTGQQLVTDEPHYTTKTWEEQKLLQNFMTTQMWILGIWLFILTMTLFQQQPTTQHSIYIKKILNYPHALSSHHYRTTYMQMKTSAKSPSIWPIKISWSHLLGQQEYILNLQPPHGIQNLQLTCGSVHVSCLFHTVPSVAILNSAC